MQAGPEMARAPIHRLSKVEPGPVQIGKRMKDQRREVRRVGDQIAFAGEQAGKLRRELIVEIAFSVLWRHLADLVRGRNRFHFLRGEHDLVQSPGYFQMKEVIFDPFLEPMK